MIPSPVKQNDIVGLVLYKTTNNSVGEVVDTKGWLMAQTSGNRLEVTQHGWEFQDSKLTFVPAEDSPSGGNVAIKYSLVGSTDQQWYYVKHSNGRYLYVYTSGKKKGQVFWNDKPQKVKFLLSTTVNPFRDSWKSDKANDSWIRSLTGYNIDEYMMYGDTFSIVADDGKTTFGCHSSSKECFSAPSSVDGSLFQIVVTDQCTLANRESRCFVKARGNDFALCNVNASTGLKLCSDTQWSECSASGTQGEWVCSKCFGKTRPSDECCNDDSSVVCDETSGEYACRKKGSSAGAKLCQTCPVISGCADKTSKSVTCDSSTGAWNCTSEACGKKPPIQQQCNDNSMLMCDSANKKWRCQSIFKSGNQCDPTTMDSLKCKDGQLKVCGDGGVWSCVDPTSQWKPIGPSTPTPLTPSTPSSSSEWIIWTIMIIILLAVLAGVYFYLRERRDA